MNLLVYSAPWCSDCREAKRFLTKHNIAYLRTKKEKLGHDLEINDLVAGGEPVVGPDEAP